MELGYDYNQIIKNKKAFRNPSIYDKLIIHCNIDELGLILSKEKCCLLLCFCKQKLICKFSGTNFPPELYDGHLFGKESYYEELAKVQKIEMDRREKVFL